MNFDSLICALALLTAANSAPVIAKRLLGESAAWPIDGNWPFFDGSPVFGPSKTIRGVAAAVAMTAILAMLLGLSWHYGALTAAASMAGDLLSSFIKRRLRMPPSSRATGLDQIPESLFGALAARMALPLTNLDVAVVTLAFFAGQLLVSRLSFEIGLRKEPY